MRLSPIQREVLSSEKLRELFYYDSQTGIFTRLRTSGGYKSGTIAGSINSAGYVIISIDHNRFTAHRIAWLFIHNEWPKEQIDHINGIRSDNRISNLREANQSQNNANMKIRKDNSCGAKGVSIFNQNGKYRAYVNKDGKQFHIGYFDTKDEAVEARKLVFERLFGEFARAE